MGIRFRCQACTNKVNVKDFLAGKRGICPKCGVKFTIPEQSDPEFQSAADEPEPAAPAPVANPAIVVTTPSSPAGAIPVAAPIAAATAAGHSPATSTAQVYAAPQFAAPQTQAPQQPQPAAYAPTMPAPGFAAGPRDPFSEAPHAQWYVRHASGQQYGPAPAPTMQKWLAEGRVPGDGMVWREGWSDWQVASMVFPQLAAPLPMARGPVAAPYATPPGMFPTPAAPAPANDPFAFGAPTAAAPSSPASQFVHHRRDNSQMMLIISIILFIAIAVVGGVLWYVLTKPKETDEDLVRHATQISFYARSDV